MTDKTIRDAGEAFESAIRAGVLSDDPHMPQFTGHYMYMYTDDMGVPGRHDCFKHISSREYVTAPVTV